MLGEEGAGEAVEAIEEQRRPRFEFDALQRLVSAERAAIRAKLTLMSSVTFNTRKPRSCRHRTQYRVRCATSSASRRVGRARIDGLPVTSSPKRERARRTLPTACSTSSTSCSITQHRTDPKMKEKNNPEFLKLHLFLEFAFPDMLRCSCAIHQYTIPSTPTQRPRVETTISAS